MKGGRGRKRIPGFENGRLYDAELANNVSLHSGKELGILGRKKGVGCAVLWLDDRGSPMMIFRI